MSINTTDMNLETLKENLQKIKKGKRDGMTQAQVIEILGEPSFSQNFGKTTHLIYKTSLTQRTEFQVIINNDDNKVSDDFGVNPILDLN